MSDETRYYGCRDNPDNLTLGTRITDIWNSNDGFVTCWRDNPDNLPVGTRITDVWNSNDGTITCSIREQTQEEKDADFFPEIIVEQKGKKAKVRWFGHVPDGSLLTYDER